jgi:hypothetical protein
VLLWSVHGAACGRLATVKPSRRAVWRGRITRADYRLSRAWERLKKRRLIILLVAALGLLGGALTWGGSAGTMYQVWIEWGERRKHAVLPRWGY